MRVLLVEPTQYRDGEPIKESMRPTQLISLTLPYLAAWTPADVEVDIAYDVAEDIEEEYDLKAYDVVAFTVQTVHLRRVLHLLSRLRAQEVKTVVGGPATIEDGHNLVRVLSRFADAVVIGEGELTWPRVLHDLAHGSLKQVYQTDEMAPIQSLPLPRFELFKFEHIEQPYILPSLTARGCPRRCTFCSEFIYGKWRLRPVDDVVTEVLQYRDRFQVPRVVFRDDDFLVHPKRSIELLSRLIGEGIEWGCQTDLNLARHRDLINVALASGMRTVSFGLESVREENRIWTEKSFFTMPEAEDLLLELHRAGVETQVNIIFGFDFDDPDIFDETLEFLERTGVSRFFPSILYPIPGTPLFEDFRAEGRLLADRPPGIDDPLAVWFKPKRMSAQQLVEGYLYTQRKFEEMDDSHKAYWLSRERVVI
jgi:radical SAM superfamily enzyme YgiQ (UPF0313 family)